MKTIEIDDSTFDAWTQRARARGLSVAEWLKRKADDRDSQPSPQKLSVEERLRRFDELFQMARPFGGNTDYSRDAIYP